MPQTEERIENLFVLGKRLRVVKHLSIAIVALAIVTFPVSYYCLPLRLRVEFPDIFLIPLAPHLVLFFIGVMGWVISNYWRKEIGKCDPAWMEMQELLSKLGSR